MTCVAFLRDVYKCFYMEYDVNSKVHMTEKQP